ncbi:MAG TPA: trypsin-like peptidase domain-containing protein, partial [Herpetosiphonaceae bacterium]
LLLLAAFAGGSISGGAVGSALTARAASQAAGASDNLPSRIQPIAQASEATVASAVYAAASPSVVEISATAQAGRGRFSSSGTGSGFVVDKAGLILTNYHVVEGATTLSVRFQDGSQSAATVVGSDRANDLALLQVDELPASAPPIALGDSDAVVTGETAIAIGSPFGLEQTVTQGIVSAVDRTWSSGTQTMRGMIQTDAPINPGNSGGPLLNAKGEVIGISTLIESPVEGNVGIGFAVPINTARRQLDQLQAGADLQQGYMGVSIEESAQPGQTGVAVGAVNAGSGAEAAGLQAGDLITALDGAPTATYDSLAQALDGKQPGDKVTVTIERAGEQQELTVTLQERAAETQ